METTKVESVVLTPEQQSANDRAKVDLQKANFRDLVRMVGRVDELTRELKEEKEKMLEQATSLRTCPVMIRNEHGKSTSIGAVCDLLFGPQNKKGIYQAIKSSQWMDGLSCRIG